MEAAHTPAGFARTAPCSAGAATTTARRRPRRTSGSHRSAPPTTTTAACRRTASLSAGARQDWAARPTPSPPGAHWPRPRARPPERSGARISHSRSPCRQPDRRRIRGLTFTFSVRPVYNNNELGAHTFTFEVADLDNTTTTPTKTRRSTRARSAATTSTWTTTSAALANARSASCSRVSHRR